MANKLYPKGREHFAIAGVNWSSDNIKVAALKQAYTYSDTHEFVTNLGANIVARSSNLTTKTYVSGILKSDPAVFATMTGAAVYYFAIFKDTGVDGTSPLLYYIDTATNLPFTPSGIDVNVNFDPTTGDFQI